MVLVCIGGVLFLLLSLLLRVRRNRKIKKIKEELNRQQLLFKKILEQAGIETGIDTAPLTNSIEEKPFSIGWIIFFTVLFLFLYWILQPWIEAISILGLKDFMRMIRL